MSWRTSGARPYSLHSPSQLVPQQNQVQIRGIINWRMEEITPSSATCEGKALVSMRAASSIAHSSHAHLPLNERDSMDANPPCLHRRSSDWIRSPEHVPGHDQSSHPIHPINRDLVKLKSRLENFSIKKAACSFFATSTHDITARIQLSTRISRICHSLGNPWTY